MSGGFAPLPGTSSFNFFLAVDILSVTMVFPSLGNLETSQVRSRVKQSAHKKAPYPLFQDMGKKVMIKLEIKNPFL